MSKTKTKFWVLIYWLGNRLTSYNFSEDLVKCSFVHDEKTAKRNNEIKNQQSFRIVICWNRISAESLASQFTELLTSCQHEQKTFTDILTNAIINIIMQLKASSCLCSMSPNDFPFFCWHNFSQSWLNISLFPPSEKGWIELDLLSVIGNSPPWSYGENQPICSDSK
jgi:hypothetical protein